MHCVICCKLCSMLFLIVKFSLLAIQPNLYGFTSNLSTKLIYYRFISCWLMSGALKVANGFALIRKNLIRAFAMCLS